MKNYEDKIYSLGETVTRQTQAMSQAVQKTLENNGGVGIMTGSYDQNLSLLVLLPIFAYKKDTCQNLPVSLLYFSKITHLYSIKGIEISSVQTSFPYIMMIWKQWQPADMVKLSDFSPFWLCVPAFQQVCL